MWSHPNICGGLGKLNLHWLFLAFSLILCATRAALAQDCGECSRPRVVLYDCDVQVPRPTIPDSIVKWFDLFWPTKWANGYLSDNDPSKDCITLLDGAMVNSHEYQNDTLRFGPEYENLPPPGPVKSATYLITSIVTGSNGNYTFTLRLETAESREIVVTNSQSFIYGVSSGQVAGQAAASAFMPLFQTIQTFEVNKRNSDVTVAIRDMLTRNSTPEMTVTPRKSKLTLGDSTDVDVTLIDCDGVPLANRTISFAAQTFQGMLLDGPSGGIVRPTTITTDADGKATVKFTSTSTGPGVINAWHVHKKPCGRSGVFNGQAIVNINPRSYEVSIFGSYMVEEKVENHSPGAPVYAWNHNSAGAHIKFVYELHNATQNPDSFLEISYPPQAHDSIRGLYTSLGYTFSSLDDERVQPDGKLETVVHTEFYAAGNMTPSATVTNFDLQWSVQAKSVDLNAGYYMQGESSTRDFDKYSGWTYDSNPWSDTTSISLGTAVDEHTAGASFTKQNGIYIIEYNEVTVDSSVSQGGTIDKRSVWKGFNIWITPFNRPTSVEEQHIGNVPPLFRLDQNYPNPFNPTTRLKYALPVESKVHLAIYDVLGRVVATLRDNVEQAGYKSVEWKAAGLASGVYIYRLEATAVDDPGKKFTEIKKMLLLQ